MLSEQALPGRPRIADAFAGAAALPAMVFAGVYVLLLAMAERLLNDPDTYWHLAVARWITTHRALPRTDPFSFTMAGEPWIAFEWLSELALAGAHAAAGWSGVVVLAAAAGAFTFALLAWSLTRDLAAVPALILVTTAFVLTAPHLLARPHVLVLPVMVAWIGALVRAVDRGVAPPFRLLPLMVLWANLHGSVCVGVAMVAPVALDAIVTAPPAERLRLFKSWTLFGLLAAAAASLTPYGPSILLMPIHTLGLGEALSIITEWQPQDFGRLGAFEIVLLLGLGYALHRGVRLPPVRIVVVLGLLHLALAQSRHADLLAVLTPLFIARPLARHLGEAADPVRRGTTPTGVAVGCAAALAAVVAGLAATRQTVPPPHATPAAAVAAADLGRAGPVLNSYNFGGYLIHAGIPPFIDGRGELYGRTLMLRHHRALMLQDLPDFLRLLEEYRIAATLLAPGTPALALLDRLDGWERVHADAVAVVHKRRPGTAAAAAAPAPADSTSPGKLRASLP